MPLSFRVSSDSYPCSRWWYPTISSSAALFFCLQSFPASGSFPMSQLFASGGQSIGASALASVLPMNIQGWFPLELTGLISLQSKGLSRVFSSTTIQKHQFFSIQPSLWFNFHICTWLLENHGFDYMHFCGQSDSKGNEPNQLVTKSCLTLQPHENCQAPLYMGLSRQEYWSE